jgi:UDP-2,3-diacylglucosamine pyrophosphatase LpxH
MQQENVTKLNLDRIYQNPDKYLKKLPLTEDDRYAVISDLHLGDGGRADKFVHNEETLESALKYYLEQDYSIILLGDIEELWQFDLPQITARYGDTIYKILSKFPRRKMHRVFGNHDHDWAGLCDPINRRKIGCGAPEGILLGDDILLVHGHQGEKFSDQGFWISRYWIRIFKLIEPLLTCMGYKNYSATESQVPRDRERWLYEWAKANRFFLICGHTHRAIFASQSYHTWLKEKLKLKRMATRFISDEFSNRSELLLEYFKEIRKGRNINTLEPHGDPLPCYFNSGCGLYRRGITNLEIELEKVRLIKWDSDTTQDLEKRRIKLWREGNWSDFRRKFTDLTN